MILNEENLFLIILAFIWIIGSVFQDLKRREVDNIWNFSLIFFALGYRFAVSVFNMNYWFFINGLLGFFVFLILGNVFYYSRVFAGGDAKLLISLGTILPLSYDWMINLKIFGLFVFLVLGAGAFYVLVWSFFLVFLNFDKFKKEFKKQFQNYKIISSVFFVFLLFVFLLLVLLGKTEFALASLVFIFFPLLFVFAKSVEESCMVKLLSKDKITEGDWLYKDIVVNGRLIKANWEGISKKELNLIKRYYKKKVLIKQGIPFTPGFFFGFLILVVVLWKYGIRF